MQRGDGPLLGLSSRNTFQPLRTTVGFAANAPLEQCPKDYTLGATQFLRVSNGPERDVLGTKRFGVVALARDEALSLPDLTVGASDLNAVLSQKSPMTGVETDSLPNRGNPEYS